MYLLYPFLVRSFCYVRNEDTICKCKKLFIDRQIIMMMMMMMKSG